MPPSSFSYSPQLAVWFLILLMSVAIVTAFGEKEYWCEAAGVFWDWEILMKVRLGCAGVMAEISRLS